MRQNDPDLVAREYKTVDRLARRRLDRTAWLHGEDEAWLLALQAIAEARPQRALDAGCGTGEFAALIAAPEVVCIDLSPAAVEAARSRALEARVADIQDLPFRDGEFDVVTCNWVLYHLPERERGLTELERVLRPGGCFVGIYNARDHMRELWSAVGDPSGDEDDFDCDRGLDELARHFARVERREAHTKAMWVTRDALQAYLDAFLEWLAPCARRTPPIRSRRHATTASLWRRKGGTLAGDNLDEDRLTPCAPRRAL